MENNLKNELSYVDLVESHRFQVFPLGLNFYINEKDL